MSPLRLALLSLSRRRVPTLIAVLSIAISVACGGILLRLYHLSTSRFESLGRGWEAVVGAKAGGLEILLGSLNGEGPYPDYLPYVLFQSLHAQQSVRFEDGQTAKPNYLKSISPFLYFAKLGDYRAAGTDENFIATIGEGSHPFAEGHWVAAEGEAVLGAVVAREKELKAGDVVKLRTWQGAPLGETDLPFKVSGVLRPTRSAWDRMIFSDVVSAQKAVAGNRAALGERSIWGEKVLNYFFVNLHPGGFKYLENLVNKRTVGQVVQVEDEKIKLEELTGVGKSIGLFVSIFILLLSSLSVSAMLVTRFEAMGVQLAVLRAIGYGRGEIGRWLLWEGFLLGLAGVVGGAVIDAIGFPVLRELLGPALPPNDLVTSSLFESGLVWGLALVATVFAIFIPLIRLYRQDVHQALKG